MDNLTPDQRKKNMQHIRSDNTKIETILRKALWDKGYRYRKNYKELPGKPDIVLTKYKIAIFCDGEFFHGKDWEVLKPRLEKGNKMPQTMLTCPGASPNSLHGNIILKRYNNSTQRLICK